MDAVEWTVAILTTLVLISLVWSLVRMYPRREKFVDPSMILNVDKSILYNSNGLYNFYSSGSATSVFTTNASNVDMVKYITAFYSDFRDSVCTSTVSSESSRPVPADMCTNYFIDQCSTTDTLFQSLAFKENSCQSLATVTSADKANTLIRILSSYYNLNKRCIVFEDVSFERMVVDGGAEAYYVTIRGDVTAMVMSRPTFIAFGSYGLFSIKMPQSFDSTSKENKFSIMRVSNYNGKSMYTSMTTNMFDIPRHNPYMQAIIYYLSYTDKSKVDANIDMAATMTLVLSKAMLTSQPKTLVQIPTNYSSSDTTIVAGALSIVYDGSSLDPMKAFSVSVNYGQPATSLLFYLPSSMVTAMTKSVGSGDDYHIVMTYSLDVIILSCFTKYGCYMTQTLVNDGMNSIVLKYSLSAVWPILKQTGLSKDLSRYSSQVNLTAIPNYAVLAKTMGYDI